MLAGMDLGMIAVVGRPDPASRSRALRAAEVTVVRALDAARHRLTLLASLAGLSFDRDLLCFCAQDRRADHTIFLVAH